MKKVFTLFIVVVLLLSLTACGGTPSVKMLDSRMTDDSTVVARFTNDGKKTVTYVKGALRLFGGSANSQNPIAYASFEWTGTCKKGESFTVTAKVNNSSTSSGLANKVNRIGVSMSDIK